VLAGALLVVAASVMATARSWADPVEPVPVRVMIVNAFGFEAAPWLAALGPGRDIRVPGLTPGGASVRSTNQGLGQMATGLGHPNAAASMTAVLYSGRFDLSHAYFLIAGIAGIDPGHGTIGSVAWARYAVDAGIAHEIDPREAPLGWHDGFFGVMTDGPTDKPSFDYHTEVYRLDEALVDAAMSLSRNAALEDSADVAAYRARYRTSVARDPPSVIQCDTVSGDTWWAGRRLGERSSRWTRLLTDGKGNACTTQQEDNATLNALTRGSRDGLVDLRRVAILRSG
jgi:purine nucleoside permease